MQSIGFPILPTQFHFYSPCESGKKGSGDSKTRNDTSHYRSTQSIGGDGICLSVERSFFNETN